MNYHAKVLAIHFFELFIFHEALGFSVVDERLIEAGKHRHLRGDHINVVRDENDREIFFFSQLLEQQVELFLRVGVHTRGRFI